MRYTLTALTDALHQSWSEETGNLEPGTWKENNPARGQCVASSLVVQDYLGGEIARYEVTSRSIHEMHYFNILDDGTILDTTGQQYTHPVTMKLKPVTLEGYQTVREKRLAHPPTNERYRLLKSRVRHFLAIIE